MTRYEEFEPEPRKGWSPGVVALIATLVLALGLGGAWYGVRLSNSAGNPTATTPPATSAPSVAPTTAAPTEAPTSAPATTAPTAAPTTGAGFPVPDVYSLDFREARTQLRALGLGVNLVFTGTGEGDYTVSHTFPARNQQITKGKTITVYVPALAPDAIVPNLIGADCATVARKLGDNGLFPEYATGRKGKVSQQEPTPESATPVKWNGKVKVWCGTP